MKKTLITATVFMAAAIMMFSACKKDDTPPNNPSNPYKCTSCTTTPEAVAANDASSKGIYKGIVIGSTGTIKFSVQNGGNDIIATMVIDGTTVNLQSNIQWVDGQPYVAPFTGLMNGQAVTIVFSVQSNGGMPEIVSSSIPGHPNADFALVKETSNALLECFEGTYSTTKPETGTFNILLSRPLGKWGGIARENGTTDEDDIDGNINNGTITDEDGRTMGTLSGDEITGSFKDSNGNDVTITGKRTL